MVCKHATVATDAFAGPRCCEEGAACVSRGRFFSQCLPLALLRSRGALPPDSAQPVRGVAAALGFRHTFVHPKPETLNALEPAF